MAYATRADFGDALRDHRGWSASVALLIIMFAAAAFALGIVLAIAGFQPSLPLLLLAAGLVAFAWTWLDAAHRIAGRRAHR